MFLCNTSILPKVPLTTCSVVAISNCHHFITGRGTIHCVTNGRFYSVARTQRTRATDSIVTGIAYWKEAEIALASLENITHFND